MKRKEFETGSGTVCYWVSDAPDPALPWLVFLPGLTADHTLFDPQIAYFEQRANCLTWDAPAHAQSRPYPLDFTMDDYARFVHEILKVEGVQDPVLIGQSLGGYVSQAFIDLFPGEALGFVSIDSAPLKKRYMRGWEVWCLRHTKLMYLSIPWKLLVKWAGGGVAYTQAGQEHMRSMMGAYGKREYCELVAHGYRMLANAIDADRPYELGCPTLVLCGEHDQAASTRRYNRIWTKAEGLDLVWVPDAGHNATIDNPAFVNAQIESFVTGLAR